MATTRARGNPPGRTRALPDPAEVARFLRANPAWLARQPALYARLDPPRRVHGATLADHMAAMLSVARDEAQASRRQADDVLDAGRAGLNLAERVQDAVLALLQTADVAAFVAHDLPGWFGIDAAGLRGEAHAHAHVPDAPPLPRGLVASLLGRQDVVFRTAGDTGLPEGAALHGAAAGLARHDVLVRVPVAGAPALLALASRANLLPPCPGAASSLGFLGRVVAVRLAQLPARLHPMRLHPGRRDP